jgi:hypothetical protein
MLNVERWKLERIERRGWGGLGSRGDNPNLDFDNWGIRIQFHGVVRSGGRGGARP